MLHRFVKKFALFISVKILYQNQQHGNDSLAFAENFDVEDEPHSGRLIEKSDEIMVKVECDKHVSTVEIARELSIDHSFKSFTQSWIQKRSSMFGFLTS